MLRGRRGRCLLGLGLPVLGGRLVWEGGSVEEEGKRERGERGGGITFVQGPV